MEFDNNVFFIITLTNLVVLDIAVILISRLDKKMQKNKKDGLLNLIARNEYLIYYILINTSIVFLILLKIKSSIH